MASGTLTQQQQSDQPDWTANDWDAWRQRYPTPGQSTGGAPAEGASADPFTAMGGGVQTPGGGWVPKDHPLAASGTVPVQTNDAVTPPAGPANGVTSNAPPNPTTANPAFQDAFRTSLMGMMTQNPYDPAAIQQQIQPAVNAYGQQQSRVTDDQRAALQERLAQSGLAQSGASDTGTAQIYENEATNRAGFASNLALQQMQSRQQQLMQALQIGSGVLSNDQKNMLTKELADIDAAIRNRALDVQSSLGTGSLSNQLTLGQGQLSLGLLEALLNNQQANNTLGFNIGAYTQNQNTNPFTGLF